MPDGSGERDKHIRQDSHMIGLSSWVQVAKSAPSRQSASTTSGVSLEMRKIIIMAGVLTLRLMGDP